MTAYTEEFELFWKAYPWRWDRSNSQRIKRKKAPAFEKWVLLDEETRQECMVKRKMIRNAEGSSARDCVTWLNQKGWEDIDLAEDRWKPYLPKEMTDPIGKIPPAKKPEPVYKQRKALGL